MDQILSAILGPFASYIQGSFLKDSNLSDKCKIRIRFATSWLICVVASFIFQYIDSKTSGNAFNWQELGMNLGTMFTTSQATYNLYFKTKNV